MNTNPDPKNSHSGILDGKKFFTIRGFMKSGTNWICRLLNLHPDVSGVGEFHWQNVTAAFLDNVGNAHVLNIDEDLRHQIWKRLDQFIKESLVLANRPEATWVGDRTPAHIEPSIIIGARVFNVVRDGRDVLVSRAHHVFNYPETFPEYFESKEQLQRLEQFRNDPMFFTKSPDELLSCDELVVDTGKHWAAAIEHDNKIIESTTDLQSITVSYENVHRNTEKARRQLYEFLDVDPGLAKPLGFNTRPGFKEEMPDKFLRKGAVGDWQNYMTPNVKRLFKETAGTTLIDLKYVKDSDW